MIRNKIAKDFQECASWIVKAAVLFPPLFVKPHPGYLLKMGIGGEDLTIVLHCNDSDCNITQGNSYSLLP
jgi:hypothetical protein